MESSSKRSDGTFKGPFTVLELTYGKNSENKKNEVKINVAMLIIDQFAEKVVIKEQDSVNTGCVKSKKYFDKNIF